MNNLRTRHGKKSVLNKMFRIITRVQNYFFWFDLHVCSNCNYFVRLITCIGNSYLNLSVIVGVVSYRRRGLGFLHAILFIVYHFKLMTDNNSISYPCARKDCCNQRAVISGKLHANTIIINNRLKTSPAIYF